MNRIDRLFAITLLLQARKRIRANELAETFEVSERTIYRDIQALNESGVPVTGMPGVGYELVEGFKLAPLSFSISETQALFLGAAMLQSHITGRLHQESEIALAKLSAVLPESVRMGAARLAEIIRFTSPDQRFDLDDIRLFQLQKAIIENHVVFIRYHSLQDQVTTQRDVEPERLEYHQGAWYLSGYCRLRGEMRSFRLSRIEKISVLEERFERRTLLQSPEAVVDVQVLVAPAFVRWVRERQHYGFKDEEIVSGRDGVIFRYEVNQLSEIKSWLLSWGAGVQVLEPKEFRDQIREELKTLINLLT